jgi:hypothetical protein
LKPPGIDVLNVRSPGISVGCGSSGPQRVTVPSAGVKVDAAMKVAGAKWGQPACGQPHVVWSTPAAYGGVGPDMSPFAWADVARCRIVFNQEQRIHTAVKFCHVLVHEWGHLDGYRDPRNAADPLHSSNPRSIMAADMRVDEGHPLAHPRLWVASGAFPPCYEAVRWIDLRRWHRQVARRVEQPR